MQYILQHLSFILDGRKHTYFFKREDTEEGILSQDIFSDICQYLTEMTNNPAPSLNEDLDLDNVMTALNSYGLSIGYGLATDFTTASYGWTNEPYTEPAQKENENG